MLIDAMTFTSTSMPEPDVCIIGAGAAGMVLALELAESGLSVTLLETGGERGSSESGAARLGRSTGFPIDGQRLRLGGSLSEWGANCAMMDQSDFQDSKIPDVLNWPFDEHELSARSHRAASYLGGATGGGALEKTGRSSCDHWDGMAEKLSVKSFVKGDKDLAKRLVKKLSQNEDLALVVTHATVLGFDLNDAGNCVTHVRFAMPDRSEAKLASKTFILAAGLENVPILLRGLGEDPEKTAKRWPQLGRRLHSHLLSLNGVLHPNKGVTVPDRYCLSGDLGQQGSECKEFFGLRLGGEGSLNSVTWLTPLNGTSALIPKTFTRAARRRGSIWSRFISKKAQQKMFGVRHFMEQPARPDARVRLGKAAGRFNLQEPIWDWCVKDEELEAMQAICAELDRRVQSSGIGCVLDYSDRPPTDAAHIKLNAHPMGGSIAGRDAHSSVVGRNLNVHGIANLYVCGGSVFPRGGTAMVTTVIVQLALRLADHLVQRAVP